MQSYIDQAWITNMLHTSDRFTLPDSTLLDLPESVHFHLVYSHYISQSPHLFVPNMALYDNVDLFTNSDVKQ